MKYIFVGLVIAIFTNPSFAQSVGAIDETYREAFEAVNRGNCEAALNLLRKFKIDGASIIEKNKNLADRVELQITECENRGRNVRIYLRGSIEDSIKIPFDQNETRIVQSPDAYAGAASGGLGAGLIVIIILLLILL